MNEKTKYVYRTECNHWEGGHNISGYAVDSKGDLIINQIWEDNNGKIVDGYNLSHTCGNNWCVNVSHVYLDKPKSAKYSADYVEVGRGRNRRIVVAHQTARHVKTTRKPRKVRALPFNQDDIFGLFNYEEGQLYWKESAKGRNLKKPIGTIDRKIGVVACSVKGTRCNLHELVWIYHEGPLEEDEKIIFKNGDPLDCRIENLTLVLL